MIYSLNGVLTYTDLTTAVIDCGGVGFKCAVTVNTQKKLPKIGEKVFLYTCLNVREDAMDLFGFYDPEEMTCFKMLISVNGVYPKAALSVLSELTAGRLAAAIAAGDSKALTKAQGVGAKIAQRIVLELKDKIKNTVSADKEAVSDAAVPNDASAVSEAVAALVSLGYSQSEAASAVSGLDSSLSVEDLIMQALRFLARQV